MNRSGEAAATPRWLIRLPALVAVRVRAVRAQDGAHLAVVFAGMSASSRYARFLYSKRSLTARELQYFSDVDHHDHVALLALTRIRSRPVGVARFIRDAVDPTSAEVAGALVDEWQNRGIGTRLAHALAGRARRANITTFTALAATDNARVSRVLSKLGPLHRRHEDSSVTLHVQLSGEAGRRGQLLQAAYGR